MQEVYDAYSDKIKNPDHWVKRTILRKILEMDKSKDKFNKFINEIEGLDDSYLYIQGTLKSNTTFNKVRMVAMPATIAIKVSGRALLPVVAMPENSEDANCKITT